MFFLTRVRRKTELLSIVLRYFSDQSIIWDQPLSSEILWWRQWRGKGLCTLQIFSANVLAESKFSFSFWSHLPYISDLHKQSRWGQYLIACFLYILCWICLGLGLPSKVNHQDFVKNTCSQHLFKAWFNVLKIQIHVWLSDGWKIAWNGTNLC